MRPFFEAATSSATDLPGEEGGSDLGWYRERALPEGVTARVGGNKVLWAVYEQVY
jgi:hypothetical protein